MLKIPGIYINERSKIILISTAISIFTLIICLNIIKGQIRNRRDLDKSIMEEQKKIVLRQDIGEAQAKYEEYKEYFYDNMSKEAFRTILSDVAKDSGADIISIKALRHNEFADIAEDALEISLRATYEQLVKFVAGIESLKQFTKIETLLLEELPDIRENAPKDSEGSYAQATVSAGVSAYSAKD